MSGVQFGNLVFGTGSENILSQLINLSRVCWLGGALFKATIRLPYRPLFSFPLMKWQKPRIDQQVMWQRGIGKYTVALYTLQEPEYGSCDIGTISKDENNMTGKGMKK